jgi:hypothetical protein
VRRLRWTIKGRVSQPRLQRGTGAPPDCDVSTSVDDSDERSSDPDCEPALFGGQFSRVSAGTQSDSRVVEFGFVFEPDSARRIVPLLLELAWSVSE